jgi:hypothetical protein
MKEIERIVIPVKEKVRSLCWCNGHLMDIAAGDREYRLDGTVTDIRYFYAYRFDHAIATADGRYVALIERLGTKGLILKEDGRLIREINRSYYFAHRYEYPLTFLTRPDGRIALVHCPNQYNQIEIEDVETGEKLAVHDSKCEDIFHSRLAASGDSRYLLSAGWVWHPVNDIRIYDMEKVWQQPSLLAVRDNYWFTQTDVVVNTAAFVGGDALVVTTSGEEYDPKYVGPDEEQLLRPDSIGVLDLISGQLLSQAPLEETAGTLMPVGDYVVGFFQHPKLIEVATGRVVARWEDLSTGQQNSSIITSGTTMPPLAMDAANKRFAVASDEAITVIQLG